MPVSASEPVAPADTVTEVPVVVLPAAVAVDKPLEPPSNVTVAVSPGFAPDAHSLATVNCLVMRVFVNVQVTAPVAGTV